MIVKKEILQGLSDKLDAWMKEEQVNRHNGSYYFSVDGVGGSSISESEYLIFERYDIGRIKPKSKFVVLEPILARGLAYQMQSDIASSVEGEVTIDGG